MLGGIVAFLTYVNVSWVPRWIESKESSYSATVTTDIGDLADLLESQIARGQTSRSFSATLALGVRGLPLLGSGASSGELAVAAGPTLNVSVASLPVLTAGGSFSLTSHTLHYPNQTWRYTLGAMEITQSSGAWVDLRNLLHVERTTAGALSLVVKAVNVTSQDQQVGGSGEAKAIGVVTNVTTTTDASSSAHRVHVAASNVQAGAWRSAVNRTLGADGLSGVYQDCDTGVPSGTHYCFPSASANNSVTRVEIVLFDVATGWSREAAKVAMTVTG